MRACVCVCVVYIWVCKCVRVWAHSYLKTTVTHLLLDDRVRGFGLPPLTTPPAEVEPRQPSLAGDVLLGAREEDALWRWLRCGDVRLCVFVSV